MVTLTSIDFPGIFDVGSSVGFTLSNGEHYEGEISYAGYFFIQMRGVSNGLIFRELGIIEVSKYIRDLLGYYLAGDWPYVKYLDDLKKVLHSLLSYKPDRIPEDKKVIINDDEKKPFTLNIIKLKEVKLNFKI